MHDFWPGCGYRLLARTPEGQLQVTDDFLRSLLERPELAPVAGSCADEIALHAQLLASPRADYKLVAELGKDNFDECFAQAYEQEDPAHWITRRGQWGGRRRCICSKRRPKSFPRWP